MQQPIVIKIGGHEIADHDFLTQLSSIIVQSAFPVVVVHGGGAEISHMQEVMGITPRYVDGLRVTDEASLAVVEMVLCGVVNKRLVRYLLNAGADALGLCGVDQGLIQASKMQHPVQDMGFTGAVGLVRAAALLAHLQAGLVPVIAPICLGTDATPYVSYNVNADHVAGAVAVAINALRVVFLTNVQGVLVAGQHISHMDEAQALAYIADGTISGGMIPKVKTALSVLESGVPQASITNLKGLQSHGGTVFTKAAPVP